MTSLEREQLPFAAVVALLIIAELLSCSSARTLRTPQVSDADGPDAQSHHCQQCANPNAKFCCKFFQQCCDMLCGEELNPCWPSPRSCAEGRCGRAPTPGAMPPVPHGRTASLQGAHFAPVPSSASHSDE